MLLDSTALVVRQTEATGYTSHWCHLVLATCCYSPCQSVLGPHRPTLLFATAPGAGQPGRPALLGEPPWTPDAIASRGAKDYLCLSAMALCFLGTPLTPQSPLSLPGSLTCFLLRMCLRIFTVLFFLAFMNYFSKKFAKSRIPYSVACHKSLQIAGWTSVFPRFASFFYY